MRHEFPKTIKREALKRAASHCEAVGSMYGLAPNQRCNANIGHGFQFDHILADSNGGKPTLENCAVVCTACHKHKTRHHDTPRAAKTKRQSDKHMGIRQRPRMQSRGFGVTFDNTKHLERL